ncbi:hypothetical protein AB0C18_18240 [Nonomuraea muscovyensis]|uniref:MmyB family transcriptional regulator n=1 Tax=Nonomuraea muscovyensis TaxID=1124761 RepID=UPI0033D5D8C8
MGRASPGGSQPPDQSSSSASGSRSSTRACALYPDWPVVAAEAVARLWMDAVHSPDDQRLAALVGELSEIWSWTGRRCGPATPPTGSWLPHRPGRHPGP